ncbi:MAG: amidohydrolase family protein [Candidatus Thermoplasmatota archaeon]|nr:amidohydrolase family protein [Candidatus Thermoplasmatota archaeon]
MKLKFGMLFFVVMIVLSTNAISVINGKTMIMNSNEGNIHEDPAYFIQSNNTSNLPKLLKLLLLSFLFGISLIFLLKQYVSSQKIDYVLQGTIITMKSIDKVIPQGNILIEDGVIKAIWTDNETPPFDISDLPIINTSGYIFPGLIDCHNHLMYNTIPIWNVTQQYSNRYEWQSSPYYLPDIQSPRNILVEQSYADLLGEVVKYAEVKALVGGTTAIHGAGIADHAFTHSIVRNIETYNYKDCRLINTVSNIKTWDESNVLFYNNLGLLRTFLIHLAEGTDELSHHEFEILRDKDLIIQPLVAIHSVALNRSNFAELAAVGASMIWSPTSNLLLYGDTADVIAAWEEGACVGLAPDWSPSGTKNCLGELKIADQWNKDKLDGFFSDYNLTEMVITNPAKMCGWEHRYGKIEEGYAADFLVISRYNDDFDPYRSLINAIDFDVDFVTVGGDPLYGLVDYLEVLKPGDYEILEFDGWRRAMDITKDYIPNGNQRFIEISSILSEVMTFDPEILYDYFDVGDMTIEEFTDWLHDVFPSGLHPVPLDPLITYGDSSFFQAIEQSENLNSNFNCNLSYYYERQPNK